MPTVSIVAPLLGVMESKMTPAGSVFTISTLVAGPGPLDTTVKVYVMMLPTGTGVRPALLVMEMDTCIHAQNTGHACYHHHHSLLIECMNRSIECVIKRYWAGKGDAAQAGLQMQADTHVRDGARNCHTACVVAGWARVNVVTLEHGAAWACGSWMDCKVYVLRRGCIKST
jgi:hypothetical protein